MCHSLLVQPVQTERQWSDFFSLKRSIYRDDPAAVMPLRKMERQQVDRERNPFYQHADMEAFICLEGKRPVGRVAAIVDHLHQERYQDDVGFIGFFECIDDQRVAHLLIEQAEQWLAAHGCKAIRGPVNPSMKGEFGVLVEGHEYPPSVMMAHTPLRYERHLLEEGFEIETSFYAFRTIISETREECEHRFRTHDAINQKFKERFPKLSLRPISPKNYASTLREINELGNVVRSTGWGFVPLTPAELEFMIENLRPVIRYDMIHVAYWEDQLVGFIVNIPDVNWALKRTLGKWDWLRMIQLPFLIPRSPRTRVIAIGIDHEHRMKGIATQLIKQLTDRHEAFDEWEFSWVHEANAKSIRIIDRVMPITRYKTYRLYQKPIQALES